MLDKIQRSWRLMREAWTVLMQDRELLVLPVMSGICSLVASLGFLAPLVLAFEWSQSAQGSSFRASLGWTHYLLVFAGYLVTYFVVLFFNAALVACVRIRLGGGDPTVADGLRFSSANAGRLFEWALVSATVGTVIRMIEDHAEWLAQIVASILGIAWSLATAFIVPVLVYEKVRPFDALKRSAETMRRTWGEALVANTGLGIATGLVIAASILFLIGGCAAGIMLLNLAPAVGTAVLAGTVLSCIVFWVGLSVIASALQGIFLTACYEYAQTGTVPLGFTPEFVAEAWRPKR
jgi:hypothetical protein